jgi:hypothetical protein
VKRKTSKEEGSPMEMLILSRLDSFESSVRSLDTKVGDLVAVSIKQEENLKEHMKRSDLLEKKLDEETKELSMRLKPVEKHVNFVDVTIKLATALVLSTVAILGLIEGFAKIKSLFP